MEKKQKKISFLDREPDPMNIHEAIEAMKIVRLFADDLIDGKPVDLMGAIQIIVDKGAEDNQLAIELLRLVALMFHKDVTVVSHEMERKTGMDFVVVLALGFTSNPVTELINFGWVIGINEKAWIYGTTE